MITMGFLKISICPRAAVPELAGKDAGRLVAAYASYASDAKALFEDSNRAAQCSSASSDGPAVQHWKGRTYVSSYARCSIQVVLRQG
jgi:hypothetical protein